MSTKSTRRKSAVFMAHPGHELRIHHWIELNSPTVLVLTDGSGRTNRSRLPSTEKILEKAGASRGPLFGRYPDKEIYDRLLAVDAVFFVGVAREIGRFILDEKVERVAGDAAEGYNTSHDACRYIVDAACAWARRLAGRDIPAYRFALAGRPDEEPAQGSDQIIRVDLDPAALERKLAAALGYPELAAEIETARQKYGFDPFKTEILRITRTSNDYPGNEPVPFYEKYGEKQKAAGIYKTVIRYESHVAPVRAALMKWAENGIA